MSTVASGTEYEDFIAQVYAAILCAEQRDSRIRQIALEKRKRVIGVGGNPNEIDIYWEYEVAGIIYKTAIECKAYSASSVPVGDVRDFAYKLRDIGGIKGLFVTLCGYQSGAETVAKNENIDLVIIRKPKPSDWDGYIQKVVINVTALLPANVLSFEPSFDREWLLANGYKVGDAINYGCMNNELFIEDRSVGFNRSLHQLCGDSFDNSEFGEHVWDRTFADGWLSMPDKSLKINGIKIKYSAPGSAKSVIEIDVTDHVLAILEYVNKEINGVSCFMVGKDGIKRPMGDS